MKTTMFERKVKHKVLNGVILFLTWLNSIFTVVMVFVIEAFELSAKACIAIIAMIVILELLIYLIVKSKIPSDFHYQVVVLAEDIVLREKGRKPITFSRHSKLNFDSSKMLVTIHTSPETQLCYPYNAQFRRFLEKVHLEEETPVNFEHNIPNNVV